MKLRVLDEADAEAIEAANWYEDRSSGLGYDFQNEVKRVFVDIKANPLQHAKVEFVKVEGDVRRVLLHRFPYIVVYQVLAGEILVLTVSHMSRDPSFWQGRVD